jgi:threonine/homoserine/homoserine lactone efflux protein
MCIMFDALPSLAAFALATSITPGPNNVMVATAAANHGFRPTIPHILGIAVGFALMLALVGCGLAGIIIAYPTVHAVLRVTMAAWLCLLAWKIATASPPEADQPRRPPLGFFGAALFQWVNPKAWVICVGAASEFVTSDQALLPQVALVAATFLLICLPCVGIWAAMGRGAAGMLRSPTRLRVFNVAMALLLVASVAPVLREF